MSRYTCIVLLCIIQAVLACPNTAGVVVGSIFGTLAFVAIILGIVAFVYYKKKQKGQNKKKLKSNQEKLKLTPGHSQGRDNPTFVGDAEAGTVVHNNRAPSNKDFAGYVECREYEKGSVQRKQQASAGVPHNGSGPIRGSFLEDNVTSMAEKSRPVQKTGSSGSLDNSYPTVDANLIVVPLLSKDSMGLGFNVDGNMKEGIYVSKIHKRGPANDTGLISVGDRIMSVTISFENMVLEDAMTILSYASPYLVKLCLQRGTVSGAPKVKGSDVKVIHTPEYEEIDINHPVYRSQSLDDLRQIGKEGLLHPRRTWSEWKKPGYVPSISVEEGGLKKWKGKTDMVEETSESSDIQDAQDSQTQSSSSNFSLPDMKIDLNDLRMESDGIDIQQTAEVHFADVDFNAEAKDGTIDISQIVKEEVSDVNNAVPKPEFDTADGEMSLTLDTGVAAFLNNGEDHKRPHEEDKETAVVLDPTQSPKKLGDGEIRRSSTGSSEDAMAEGALSLGTVDLSVPTEKPPAIPDIDTKDPDDSSVKQDDKPSEEPTVGDVIRDYFGNSPTILHQFGLPAEENTKTQSMEVTTVDSDTGVTTTHKEVTKSESGVTTTTLVEKTTELITGSPDSGFLGTLTAGDNVAQRTPTSSNSSPSSRSASPSRGDEGVHIDNKISSNNVGGLNFDISPLEFNDISKEPDVEREVKKNEAKSGPKGGVAYYYSIDEYSVPSHTVRPIAGADLDTVDLGQPELIRPKPSSESTIIHSTTSVNSYDPTSIKTDDLSAKDLNDNSQTIKDFKTSQLAAQLGGSRDDGVTLSPESNLKFETTEIVTIIKQTEVPEAFTVMVNRDDSEA